ncbi:MAG: carboxypeptidase-like regulatory domain-containing protein [Acidobacteria bacterium]|nr:carboxypeptidase-like regulatory domain-containing protein [Acidobacteriota bacterium]
MLRRAHTARGTGSLLLAGVVCVLAGQAQAAGVDTGMRIRLHGSIVGFVTGPAGAQQMGATVFLLNKYGRLVKKTFTNERGAFGFDFLMPDAYTVRVNQTSFAPAAKTGVRVDPGVRSFLAIQLASVASSIQLVSAAPNAASLMSDEWKWVLRSNSTARPALRFAPVWQAPRTQRHSGAFFTETRGVLKLSAGEVGSAEAASLGDLGTGFALATSVFGSSRVMLSGNVGYSPVNGIPAAGFRTSYRPHVSDTDQFNPELKLTMKQVFLPSRGVDRMTGSQTGNLPALRSLSASITDRVQITRRVRLEVGSTLDALNFTTKLNYYSPYAVTGVDLGRAGMVELGFSSGVPPVERYRSARDAAEGDPSAELARDVAALGLMPRLSMANNTLRVQRSENYEIGYRKSFGRRSISAGFFREAISNAALTLASPQGAYPSADLLPDFNSNSAVFNAGHLVRNGFTASGSQQFGDWLTISLIFSRGGVLRTDQREMRTNDPAEIRSAIRRSLQNAVSTRMSGRLPRTGTRYLASYQWTDYRALTPGHLYLTNITTPDAGLNFSVRQPVPALPFMAGRFELHAEIRNLLAQGYLPLTMPDGRQILLMHTPRALRGGVSFFF